VVLAAAHTDVLDRIPFERLKHRAATGVPNNLLHQGNRFDPF
jgi:hypothetical protein